METVFIEVIKVRSLMWALIQYNGYSYKKGNWGTEMDTEEGAVKTRGQHSCPQTKERGLEQIFPSGPSEGTSPVDTFLSGF